TIKRSHPQPNVDLTYIGTPNDAGDQYRGLDRFGRVAEQFWTKVGAGATDDFSYGYDRDSNALFRDNLLNRGLDEFFAYDTLNQLASFNRGTHTQSFVPDALGNFQSVTTDGVTKNRTHNA